MKVQTLPSKSSLECLNSRLMTIAGWDRDRRVAVGSSAALSVHVIQPSCLQVVRLPDRRGKSATPGNPSKKLISPEILFGAGEQRAP